MERVFLREGRRCPLGPDLWITENCVLSQNMMQKRFAALKRSASGRKVETSNHGRCYRLSVREKGNARGHTITDHTWPDQMTICRYRLGYREKGDEARRSAATFSHMARPNDNVTDLEQILKVLNGSRPDSDTPTTAAPCPRETIAHLELPCV